MCILSCGSRPAKNFSAWLDCTTLVRRSLKLEFGLKRRGTERDMAVTRLRLSFRLPLALSVKKQCFTPLQKRPAQAGALLKVSTGRSSGNGCFVRVAASNTRKSCTEFPSPGGLCLVWSSFETGRNRDEAALTLSARRRPEQVQQTVRVEARPTRSPRRRPRAACPAR